jgi:hypothetical protein
MKKHKWFGKLDWAQLEQVSLDPPYKPETNGEGDAHLYDTYPDDTTGTPLDDSYMFTVKQQRKFGELRGV